MEYVLADSNSSEAYWYKRGIPTLSMAQRLAPEYPEARYILEYRADYASKGVLPTGRNWAINKIGEDGE